jgi:histidine transport system substrate-binding protein
MNERKFFFKLALVLVSMFGTLILSDGSGFAFARDYQEIRFGVAPSFAPFESRNKDGGVEGFDVDLGNAICAELKVKCVWVSYDFDAMIPGLKARKFDAILSSMAVTPARLQQIAFTQRLYSAPTSMISRKDSGLQPTIDSLKNKNVGVEQGTTQETFAKRKLETAGVHVQSYANQDQVYADLVAGRLDASFQDRVQAVIGFLKSPEGANYAAGDSVQDPLLSAVSAIGIRKEDGDLKKLLDKAITELHRDGTYDKLQTKYFGTLDIYKE